jgi:hypothetical protein
MGYTFITTTRYPIYSNSSANTILWHTRRMRYLLKKKKAALAEKRIKRITLDSFHYMLTSAPAVDKEPCVILGRGFISWCLGLCQKGKLKGI